MSTILTGPPNLKKSPGCRDGWVPQRPSLSLGSLGCSKSLRRSALELAFFPNRGLSSLGVFSGHACGGSSEPLSAWFLGLRLNSRGSSIGLAAESDTLRKRVPCSWRSPGGLRCFGLKRARGSGALSAASPGSRLSCVRVCFRKVFFALVGVGLGFFSRADSLTVTWISKLESV